ncbi:hypothetical protein CKO45_16870 [Paracraurococcus ruber]|uniref:Uncharacterized protein n=1 Tax=Paracraurococcus ruber TaxID=77675 RepID=A0ABS1CZD9_9PROT|nr:hypothetical protein [Paracraurococcus ruber]
MARCASLSAMAASSTSPASIASASVSSSMARSGTLSCAAAISTMTYQGASSGSGMRRPTPCFAATSMQKRAQSSKATSSAPQPMMRP